MKKTVIAALLMVFWMQAQADNAGLSADELNSIRTAAGAYKNAWLSNNADAVMSTFVAEPVLSPSGLTFREGQQAARDFWFPAESPPTVVTRFETSELEIGGSGDLGFVRGTFVLGFDYAGNSYENNGNYISILKRQANGEWLITHHVWNDYANQD